jgi:hypothetical protein
MLTPVSNLLLRRKKALTHNAAQVTIRSRGQGKVVFLCFKQKATAEVRTISVAKEPDK